MADLIGKQTRLKRDIKSGTKKKNPKKLLEPISITLLNLVYTEIRKISYTLLFSL